MTARTGNRPDGLKSTRPAVAPQGSEGSPERVGALALAYLHNVTWGEGDFTEEFAALADVQALLARCEQAEAAVSEANERAASSERHAERLAGALDSLLGDSLITEVTQENAFAALAAHRANRGETAQGGGK